MSTRDLVVIIRAVFNMMGEQLNPRRSNFFGLLEPEAMADTVYWLVRQGRFDIIFSNIPRTNTVSFVKSPQLF